MSKPKYFLYARKSTEDDDKQVMSIEAQLFELREYARKENLQILEEFTESKSAKKPGRVQFNIMMARIESMEGVGILAWHPDRLARNSVDGGRIIYAVDTTKIVGLRFPTFWFEPTPQGLFMLQVAFGQSKYYSDNLKQNVERGFRQKLRRGEWLTKAPFGYVNNLKTRNIDLDPVKSRLIKCAFEEYKSGKYSYESLAQFLADRGVVTRAGTPLGKASISRMLSNKSYLGLTKHHGEYFPGSFAPLLSPDLFEAVQEVLHGKAKPRAAKRGKHNFPFAGLFRCGECGSMITAQWTTGKCGGRYRYYRCTKKKGNCAQKYLGEGALVEQLKARLAQVSLPDDDTSYMLEQVTKWDLEEKQSSGGLVGHIKESERETEEKLDKLVSLFLDGDIPRDLYLVKKDELLKQKVSLAEKLDAARQERKQWVEPLRKWILDTKKAAFLVSSDDYFEIRDFVKRVGTNPILCGKSATVSFCPPSEFVATRNTHSDFADPLPADPTERAPEFPDRVLNCDPTENRTLITALRRRCPNR